MKRNLVILVLCLLCASSFAQTRRRTATRRTAPKKQTAAAAKSQALGDTSNVKAFVRPQDGYYKPQDGYYKKTSILNAKVTPYQYLREADVAFAKRVWREIDVRERMNQYLASPKARLIDILMDAIAKGELNAYDPSPTKNDPNGDEFSALLKPNQAMAKMADSAMIDTFDKNTGEKTGSRMQAGEFNPDSVIKFRIKEDWIFDKQRSVFEPRIIGIAPLIKSHAGGLNLDYQPAFWIYFPEARNILVTKEAVNRHNDATGLSFDDIFMKRVFSSYIVKESNDKDERIKDYAQGIDKLYESEKIKKSLLNYEQDLWQY
ncbi:MAG: gliding motility protein GldN [Mucilaginibacter sp.]|uniref:type IX secretion system ring protein PorN/GldN n=1 Tax=Mucilaginibacter sp. TaxID=1882438 RepID=UPI0034E58ECF